MPYSHELLETYRAILRTANRFKRTVRPLLAAKGLTGSQYRTLTRIPSEGISLTELAVVASLDPPTVSGVVDRLVKAGLVLRERSKSDRRVVQILLTDEGRSTVEEVEPVFNSAVAEGLSPLNETERATLRMLLTKVEDHLITQTAGEGLM